MIMAAILASGVVCGQELKHASVGVYAVHAETGEVLVDEGSALSLLPASCLKVVTTGAALHLLGPEYRFETVLEYDGFIDKAQILHGNLYIRGGGDPCLGSWRFPKDPIQEWVEAVKTVGLRGIQGKVIGDASRWETALAVPSWTWEDLGNYYGAGAGALSFHENSYALFFKPGEKVGDLAPLLRTEPQVSIIFHNEVRTGPEGSGDRACIYGRNFHQCSTSEGPFLQVWQNLRLKEPFRIQPTFLLRRSPTPCRTRVLQ